MHANPSIRCCGDSAITVEFGQKICVEENQKVMSLHTYLTHERPNGVIETVPCYSSLMIHYDPCLISYEELHKKIRYALQHLSKTTVQSSSVISIPVLYGGEFGPDLEEVAAYEQITPEEVIHRHTTYDCYVYMLGFSPGNAYIGCPERIFSVPRKSTPRLKIPAGAITIWESQTTIFPMEQPGGWNVIGNTPLRMFDLSCQEPFFLHPSQRVHFRAITEAEYQDIASRVACHTYQPEEYRPQGAAYDH